jgi:hypothetical protein
VNVAMPQRRGTAEETKATRMGHDHFQGALGCGRSEEGVAVSPEPRATRLYHRVTTGNVLRF